MVPAKSDARDHCIGLAKLAPWNCRRKNQPFCPSSRKNQRCRNPRAHVSQDEAQFTKEMPARSTASAPLSCSSATPSDVVRGYKLRAQPRQPIVAPWLERQTKSASRDGTRLARHSASYFRNQTLRCGMLRLPRYNRRAHESPLCTPASANVIRIAQPKPRARDLGVPFDGTPGKWNAITDVAGVTVGHKTSSPVEGKLSSEKVRSHRCHRRHSALLRTLRSRLRRVVLAKRQRRNDWHHLGRGIRVSRRPGA